jgi:hypothetical protein
MSNALSVLTPAEVEKRTRAQFEIWNFLDPAKITALYTGGHGFGYRTRAARPPHPTKESYLKDLQSWLKTLDYYRIVIDELHTAAEDNVGFAWGFYHEEFQARGREPEVHRGRFSEVMKRDSDGWRTLFYHRDATPFDERGMYVPPR